MQKTEQEKLILRYLLGYVSDDEQAWVEEHLFTDNPFYEHLRTVEAALIDDYVRDALEPKDRESFERRFLSSSELRQEVAFARELISVTQELEESEKKLPESPIPAPIPIRERLLVITRTAFKLPRLAYIFGLLMIAVLIGWNIQLQRQLGRIDLDTQALRAELERQKELAEDLAKQLVPKQEVQNKDEIIPPPTQLDTDRNAPSLATLNLSPIINTRGKGGAKSFPLSRDKRWLRVIIELAKGDKYAQYSVRIMTYDGVEVLPKIIVKPERNQFNKIILRRLPVTNFPENDYILTLEGLDHGTYNHVRDYYFSITHPETK